MPAGFTDGRASGREQTAAVAGFLVGDAAPGAAAPGAAVPGVDAPGVVAFSAESGRALADCVFTSTRPLFIRWTVLVADPALRDTPSHLRLVGHYASEFEALDAADQLAAELNSCLVPGEALLTATPLGIEPESPRPAEVPGLQRPCPANPAESTTSTSASGAR